MPPDDLTERPSGDRIAKLLARAGIASRREIERMIAEGRVAVNGAAVETPATLLSSLSGVTVDGRPVAAPEPARLFVYHKPVGLLVTERDPRGRPTIYDRLPPELPRAVPVGRLDLATEGLLLLTTDGGLKRTLELPATGVERTYRARAHGAVSQAQLEELIHGIEIEGIRYGAIDANLERRTGSNAWIEMTLTEGKNREVRRVLEHLGLQVGRLIRTRYGPFVLGDLPPGAVGEVRQHDLVAFRRTLDRKNGTPMTAPERVEVAAMAATTDRGEGTAATAAPPIRSAGRVRTPRDGGARPDAPDRPSPYHGRTTGVPVTGERRSGAPRDRGAAGVARSSGGHAPRSAPARASRGEAPARRGGRDPDREGRAMARNDRPYRVNLRADRQDGGFRAEAPRGRRSANDDFDRPRTSGSASDGRSDRPRLSRQGAPARDETRTPSRVGGGRKATITRDAEGGRDGRGRHKRDDTSTPTRKADRPQGARQKDRAQRRDGAAPGSRTPRDQTERSGGDRVERSGRPPRDDAARGPRRPRADAPATPRPPRKPGGGGGRPSVPPRGRR